MRTKNQFRILLAVIVLIVNLLQFVVVEPVSAVTANTTLTVSGEGYRTDGTYSGVPADFNGMNLDDGLATKLVAVLGSGYPLANPATYHFYNFSNMTVALTSISAVTFNIILDAGVGYYISLRPYVRVNSSDYPMASAETIRYIGGPTVISRSYIMTTNPDTGSAWDEASINNAQFGIYFYDELGATDTYWCYTNVIVTYTPSTTPTVTTQSVTNVAYSTNHTATLNGNITATGGTNPSIRGFVYDTSPHGNPAPLSPTASAYTSNTTVSGNFTTGTYTRNLQSLTKGQTYYVRACAYNSYGWAYGDEVSFTAMTDPSISTVAVSTYSATTARLLASVINSGGQLADVKFGYGLLSGNMQTYTTNTTLVENLYGTGSAPYADISGLTANTTYYYRAWINNDVSSSNGTELSFNTSATISGPSMFTANPDSTSVSLTWVNGSGSSDTLIVYKTGGYPLSKTDGTIGYNGTATSYTISGLSTGTTYYFMAWGKSGTTYSSANASVLSTTLAGSAESPIFTGYATPALWFQAPDYTKMSQFPLYGLFNWWSDSFQMPRSTFWFLLAMMFAVACGVLIYAMSHNIILGSVAVTIVVVVVSIMGLMSYWMLLPFIIATVTIIMVGQRA